MARASAYEQIKSLETSVGQILAGFDVFEWPMDQQTAVRELKGALVDARLEVRDYELAETRTEQLAQAKVALERLEHSRTRILQMSAYNVFSAIEVAHLGAQIEHIGELLR